jgi:hypothetical protein
MEKSEDYLAHAAACLKRTVKDPLRRASLIEMAIGWLRMTEQQPVQSGENPTEN